jgi:H/ACA ribonucleoprotein complex subunit 4
MEDCLKFIPKIYLRDSAVDAICHGASLAVPGIVSLESDIKVNDEVALFTQKGEAVALAKASLATDDIMNFDHGIAATSERVLMPPGTYPRMWQTRKTENDKG